ncbi:MAG: glycosyltransferase [Clostridia bacterium]|nr:glycosyltransferase [Clostridia bacterium]
MRIAVLNMVHNGSTGKIMLQIAAEARKQGNVVRTYTPVRFFRGKKESLPDIVDHFNWGSRSEACFHYYAGAILGKNGMFSRRGTNQLIKDLESFKPDIIHLHNLHSFCINFPILFEYIKKNKIRVVWTLHDCWTFTGHCPHFVIAKCDKWKTGCHHCPQPRVYPKMYIDTSKKMYELKKEWFCGVEDMTIITPSQWLADLVNQSFLKDYPVKVINNGIDLSIFKPIESDFRKKYGLENKKIVLGVSFGWGYRKGLDVFVELAKRLSDDYRIVLVGTDSTVDATLSENIISIHRTDNQTELAKIYTAADVFVNPTREEVLGMVNVEAIACGTPVVTFRTGGSPEIIDKTCGSVVEVDDVDTMEKEIIRICEEKPYGKSACLKRAKTFDMNNKFSEYVELYRKVIEK